MILAFVLLGTFGVIVAWLGIDVACQMWEERQERLRKAQNAVETLHAAIITRYDMQTLAAMEVIGLPEKKTGGRHRLSAA